MRHRRLWLGTTVLFLILLLLWIFFGPAREPKLMTGYMTRTNVFGTEVALITLTNVGNADARITSYCTLGSDREQISLNGAVRAGAPSLQPGQGDVYQLVLFPGKKGPQSYTLHFFRDGMRTRLREWLVENAQPGSRLGPFVPESLKSVPPFFKATVPVPD